MPYRRRAYRRGRYGSRDKYSVHQKAFSFTAQASPTTTAQLIVPSSATEGMRKVKHLTVNLTPILDQDGGQIWWALVYVPQGTNELRHSRPNCRSYSLQQSYQSTSTTETQSSFSSVTLLWQHGHPRHLSLRFIASSDLRTPQIYIS